MTERHLKGNSVGLTPGEIRTLDYVMRHRSTRQVVLAERMGIEPMTLSVYLDRLEAFDLVERKKDPGDRRLKLVEPTANAVKVVGDLEPTLAEIYRVMAHGIDQDELTKVATGLQAIHANLTKPPAAVPIAAGF
ncbi:MULTISPECIES: MarR family winged helix-turn-helix transcriptional regulator [unclassified Aureimonas]|nr:MULTISPECIES: MarR family transcriptional regulator [unclassified Aureimonas]